MVFPVHLDDLIGLDKLEEHSVFEAFNNRCRHGLQHVWTGAVLNSVNPMRLVGDFDAATLRRYRLSNSDSDSAESPHPWALARRVLQGLKTGIKHQAVVIGGESGSGKTYTTSKLIQYFSEYIPSGQNFNSDLLRDTCTVYEAFANAATGQNADSSRSGKYIEFHVDPTKHQIVSCHMRTALLERTRIACPPTSGRGDGNYHILHLLHQSAFDYPHLHISPAKQYAILPLNRSEGSTTDPRRKMPGVLGALSTFMSKDAIDRILRVLAAILHFGDVTANVNSANESALIQNSTFLLGTQLVGIDGQKLSRSLTSTPLSVGGQVILKPHTVQEVVGSLRGLMTKMYLDLVRDFFQWIEISMNTAMGCLMADPQARQELSTIGILDMFGFESFETNKLPQFCINWFDESLQALYRKQVVEDQYEEYRREGIPFPSDCSSMSNALNTIQHIVGVLDAQSSIGTRDAFDVRDRKLHDQIVAILTNATEPTSRVSPKDQAFPTFPLPHYAQDVIYNISGFVEQNVDPIWLSLESTDLMIASILNSTSTELPRGSRTTLVHRFAHDIDFFTKHLSRQSLHWIRCIKPADGLEMMDMGTAQTGQRVALNKETVMRQIRGSGVLSTMKVYQQGWTSRRDHKDLVKRYHPLVIGAKPTTKIHTTQQERCVAIFLAAGIPSHDYALGNTLVYMRNGVLTRLELASSHRKSERAYQAVTLAVRNVYTYRHRSPAAAKEGLLLTVPYDQTKSRSPAEDVTMNRATEEVARLEDVIHTQEAHLELVNGILPRMIDKVASMLFQVLPGPFQDDGQDEQNAVLSPLGFYNAVASDNGLVITEDILVLLSGRITNHSKIQSGLSAPIYWMAVHDLLCRSPGISQGCKKRLDIGMGELVQSTASQLGGVLYADLVRLGAGRENGQSSRKTGTNEITGNGGIQRLLARWYDRWSIRVRVYHLDAVVAETVISYLLRQVRALNLSAELLMLVEKTLCEAK